jgi:hypothetical protein
MTSRDHAGRAVAIWMASGFEYLEDHITNEIDLAVKASEGRLWNGVRKGLLLMGLLLATLEFYLVRLGLGVLAGIILALFVACTFGLVLELAGRADGIGQ